MRTIWTGVGTALVTPFTSTGDLDEQAVRRLGRRQIDVEQYQFHLVQAGLRQQVANDARGPGDATAADENDLERTRS